MDIGPGEETRVVEVLTVPHDGAEGEPVYETHFINRAGTGLIQEPMDSGGSSTPSHQKFHSERERLSTFSGIWKPEYHVKAEDLAREGFIYKGPGDRAMCVFCLKSIRKWEAQDSVAGEHKRLFPHCPWVRGKVDHINKPISQATPYKNMGISGRGVAHSSDMAEESTRLATLRDWPREREMTQEDLAQNGFYYESSEDKLSCFFCGFSISGWSLGSDIRERHKAMSPKCLMVASNRDLVVSNETQLHSELTERPGASGGIDVDTTSPAVQAVLQTCQGDYSEEQIIDAVRTLRLSKGPADISSKDILATLDPDLYGS